MCRCSSLAVVISVSTVFLHCQGPLSEVWQLTDYRVLGVKVTAQTSEPNLAEPARGERFTLSLAAADVRSRNAQTIWFVVPYALSPSDLLGSEGRGKSGILDDGTLGGAQLATLVMRCQANMPVPVPPEVLQCSSGLSASFMVPMNGGGADSTGHESLTVIGYTCAEGAIIRKTDDTGASFLGCSGMNTRGWPFSRTVSVRSGSDQAPDHNPVITEVRFGLPGNLSAITDAAPPTIQRCMHQPAMTGSRKMNAKCDRYLFEVIFTDGSRETYARLDVVSNTSQPLTERLTTHYVADRGTLEGGARRDSDAEPMSTMEISFVAPADPGPVKVYIYAFDDRGGFDWTQRTLFVQ